MGLKSFVSRNETPIFLFAVAFFLFVKIAVITVPTIASSMPRTGDDSFYNLWKAVLGGLNYSHGLPALVDIASESSVAGESSTNGGFSIGDYWRFRVRIKTFDTHSYFYDFLNRQILATGISLKWAFAVSEIVMLALLTVGLSLFLRTLFGPLAAALALVFLSLALFFIPGSPGLHFLDYGQGSLGLTLLLYHHLLEKGQSFRFAFILPLIVFLLGLHNLSKIYLVAAVAVHAASLPALKNAFNRRSLILAGVLIVPPVCIEILPSLFPGIGRFISISFAGKVGHLVNVSELKLNLLMSWDYIANSYAFVKILSVGGIIGTIVCLKIGRKRQAILLAGIGLALVIVSQFHIMPGDGNVVFRRLAVFFFILLFGFGAWLFVQGLSLKKRLVSLSLGLVVILLVVEGGRDTDKFVFDNLNERKEVVQVGLLSEQFRRLPQGTVVTYLDTDIALLSSLIAGGYRHGAIVIQNYLDARRRLFDTIRRRQPKVAVIPNFQSLNVLSFVSSQDLTPRRHGVPFRQTESLFVSINHGRNLGSLHLYVRNPGDAFTLTAISASGTGRNSNTHPSVEVPAEFTGWIQFKGDFGGLSGVTIALPAGPAWIEGVSLESPRAHLFWPWRREARVGFLMRDQKTDLYNFIDFSVEQLLGRRLRYIRGLIRHNDPVLSDDSGLVFMKTVYDPN